MTSGLATVFHYGLINIEHSIFKSKHESVVTQKLTRRIRNKMIQVANVIYDKWLKYYNIIINVNEK